MQIIIGPLGPIIGAMIGAGIAALVTYFTVMKRKRVEFFVATSEEIAPPQYRHEKIIFKVGDREMLTLNVGGIQVKNSGNTCIPGFVFELELPGVHPVCLEEVAASDPKLRSDVKLEQAAGPAGVIVKVSLGFFNPGEAFQVLTYFDGMRTDWMVNFRMEEVRFKVQ